MPCVFFCYVIICYLFSEATAFVLESSKNSTGKFLCWSLFFPENGKIISRRLFCMNKSYFCRNFFLIDWCHKRLKNTIDLSLFYGEHFYGFLESDLWKRWKKNIHFTADISLYTGHRHFEVLWSFILYISQRFVLSLKIGRNAYILPYIHKTLPTLRNEKEQQQIKFYKKLLRKLIFSRATKYLKIFFFTRTTG